MTLLPSAVFCFRVFAAKMGLLTALAALGSWTFAQAQAQVPADFHQIQFPQINRELVNQLATAQQLVGEGEQKWYAAIDRYQDLLLRHGDELVPMDAAKEVLASTQRFMQARWLIHAHLGRLPAPALQKYRERIDATAKKWLDHAVKHRDVGSLLRLVEESFCSTHAEPALELLGDAAFERGDFDGAQHWWRLLTLPASRPLAGAGSCFVVFPDPHPETVARVRAKQLVTLLFEHQADRLPAELKAYRQIHAAAVGWLAGRSGKYADIIEALVRQGQGSPPSAEQEWPTFAGSSSRQGTLASALSQRWWAGGPAWRVDLVSGELLPESVANKSPQLKQPAPPPRCFPIVAQGRVFVASSRWVRGFDLRTGRLAFQFDLSDVHKVSETLDANLKPAATADVRFGLTASASCLFARMGAPLVGPMKDGANLLDSASWLVCLRLPEAGSPKLPKTPAHLWSVAAPRKKEEVWFFEGAPLVHEKSVYIAQSRVVGPTTRTEICCFDAVTGALRWQQEVCTMREFDERTTSRCRHHLLTLAGGHVVYCSHAGAVVAVDAHSGKIAWAVRYPSRGPRTKEGQPSPRELCPVVAFDHFVLAAPADAPRLFCFDAFTGRNLWERAEVEVVHLLGVAHERLVFTTPKGIRAVVAATGDNQAGWCQPGAGSLPGYGRGVLTGDWVFWPTQDGKMPYRAFSIVSGAQVKGTEAYDPGQMGHLVPGNLACGQGCLVIATSEELLGYTPPPVPVPPPQT